MNTFGNASRREFLKRLGALGALGSAAPFAMNLAGIGTAAAAGASDYKALVCLFMLGGNDHNNTVVPYDATSHAVYAAARGGTSSAGGIALDLSSLQQINPLSALGGRQLALPTQMSLLANLFDSGKAAILANVGPLKVPISNAAQYKSGTVAVPEKLFSHNDQQATWQAFTTEGAKIGWGGRLGDMFASSNSKAIFTAISAAGNAVYLSGNQIVQYQTSTSGATVMTGANATSLFGSSIGDDALRALIQQNSSNYLEQAHADVVKRSVDTANELTTALSSLPTTDASVALPVAEANSALAKQLQIVARMIGVRSALGANRQVFFVGVGGFDTHDNQLEAQAELHTRLAGAIDYFYQATVALGVADKVTLFTASDFGRTLASNGDGSDHGWGSHHFIVGGAVKGQDVYGTMPTVAMGTTDDVGSGRLLPSTSVDQYAATLAKWFGVSASEMSQIVPNIASFSKTDLGFL